MITVYYITASICPPALLVQRAKRAKKSAFLLHQRRKQQRKSIEFLLTFRKPEIPKINSPPLTNKLNSSSSTSSAPAINLSITVKEDYPIDSLNNNDLASVRLESFTVQNLGTLAFDAVDDDDFDFFETKQSSAGSVGDTTYNALLESTPYTAPTPFSPAQNNSSTPYAAPTTPFAYSPSPVANSSELLSPASHPSYLYPSNSLAPSPVTRSTPITPHSAGPNTPAETFTPSNILPFSVDAEVKPQILRPYSSDGAQMPCPTAWLPFEFDFDAMFGHKGWGNPDSKWNYVPGCAARKKSKFDLPKFASINAKRKIYESSSLVANGHFPRMSQEQARNGLPLLHTSSPKLGKFELDGSLFFSLTENVEWRNMTLYQYADQMSYFWGYKSQGDSNKVFAPAPDIFCMVQDILSTNLSPVPNALKSMIQLDELFKAESNQSIILTIR